MISLSLAFTMAKSSSCMQIRMLLLCVVNRLCTPLLFSQVGHIFLSFLFLSFKKRFLFTYFQRGEGREKERERNISVWLVASCAPLNGDLAHNPDMSPDLNWLPLVLRLALNPLSHTSQGPLLSFPITFEYHIKPKQENFCHLHLQELMTFYSISFLLLLFQCDNLIESKTVL